MPAKQRIAIAEACGWRWSLNGYWENERYPGKYHDKPDYLNDLNAMHEVEKQMIRINDELTLAYFNSLSKSAGPNARFVQDSANIFCATAAQRAEAFLRTIGKWNEDK